MIFFFVLSKRSYSINKYPTFSIFKRGGAVEKHIGGVSVSEVVSFARQSRLARNLHSLDSSVFPDCLQDGRPWVIDFYVPWCRPCVHLIPEFRKVISEKPNESIKIIVEQLLS